MKIISWKAVDCPSPVWGTDVKVVWVLGLSHIPLDSFLALAIADVRGPDPGHHLKQVPRAVQR